MAIVISVTNQKGGVSKSTTAQVISDILGARKRKTLLIDFDPQCNTTYTLGGSDADNTVLTVIDGDCKAEDAIITTKYCDFLPSDPKLVNVELSPDAGVNLLSDAVAPVKNNYDYIIIDTGPSLGRLMLNALSTTDYVIIPVCADAYSLQGLSALHKTITNAKQVNPRLQVLGILFTRFSNRTILSRDVREMINQYADEMETTVFEHSIRDGVAVREAQLLKRPLIDYKQSAKPTLDYVGLVTEILEKMGGIH